MWSCTAGQSASPSVAAWPPHPGSTTRWASCACACACVRACVRAYVRGTHFLLILPMLSSNSGNHCFPLILPLHFFLSQRLPPSGFAITFREKFSEWALISDQQQRPVSSCCRSPAPPGHCVICWWSVWLWWRERCCSWWKDQGCLAKVRAGVNLPELRRCRRLVAVSDAAAFPCLIPPLESLSKCIR